MRPKLVPPHRLAVGDEPIETLDDRLQVAPQLGSEPEEVGQPAHDHRDVLESMRQYRDGDRAPSLFDLSDAPRDGGYSASLPSDLQVETDVFVPRDAAPGEDHAVEIVNLVIRVGPGPFEDRVLLAERVVEGQRTRARYDFPDFRRWRGEDSADSDGPLESRYRACCCRHWNIPLQSLPTGH